jgi:hypothetical protein
LKNIQLKINNLETEQENKNAEILTLESQKNILNAILSLKMPESQSSFLGSGDASKKISYILVMKKPGSESEAGSGSGSVLT